MQNLSTGPHNFRFGAFELDLRAMELRKQGAKIKLQDQPLQILALLLKQPGHVVTREELRGRLWPSDTFVDFDHSLNKAVNISGSAFDLPSWDVSNRASRNSVTPFVSILAPALCVGAQGSLNGGHAVMIRRSHTMRRRSSWIPTLLRRTGGLVLPIWKNTCSRPQLPRCGELVRFHRTLRRLSWYWGEAYAAAGYPDEAKKVLEQLKELTKQQYVMPYFVGRIYAALGKKDEAFQWLEIAYRGRAEWMVLLKTDPRLDVVRSDPRFDDLLRRMNFPP
jgi:tetratricopeptide (TPR) repeat protein